MGNVLADPAHPGRILAGRLGWYSAPARFADWRGVGRVDLSTNPLVSAHYGGGAPISFRTANLKEIRHALESGDTLRVGLDYYALQGVCRDLVPLEILQREGRSLYAGRVSVYALDESGNRKSEVPVKQQGGKPVVQLDPAQKTLWYEIAVGR